MKKRIWSLIGVIIFSTLLIGCNSKVEEEVKVIALKSEDFTLESNIKENNTGEYKIKIEFKEKSPVCSYILYENNKEVTKGIKEKVGITKFYFDIKGKESGKYKYKIEVVDNTGTQIEKNIEVKVDIPEQEETKAEEHINQEVEVVENPSSEISNPSHTTPTVPNEQPNDVPNQEASIGKWDPNLKKYNKGDIVTYEGEKYICITKHVSFTEWNPRVATSLWSKN